MNQDLQTYFQRLSSAVGTTSSSKRSSSATRGPGGATPNGPGIPQAQPARGLTPAGGGTSALLTQVSKLSVSEQPPSGKKKRAKISHTALLERSRQLRAQPKNSSPIDASKHPSLLPRMHPSMHGRKTLILDVDETLVHSSYQPTSHFDVHLPLRVNGAVCNVYVAYRPGIREFFQAICPLFEIVIFTASVSIYCDPLMNELDRDRLLGNLRLFREHCSVVNGSYVKDLSLLGRNLDQVVIIDNSPVAYLFQQRNAIPIVSWFDDQADEELKELIPVLQDIAKASNVYEVLDHYNAALQLQAEAAAAETL
jgi:Dullard-like phosphatase family protein